MSNFVRYRLRSVGDFVTVSGQVKPLYGCCFADLEEFLERTEFLRGTIASDPDSAMTFEQLMLSDELFRASVSRCLEMHGISLKDVGLRQMQDLLLYEVIDQQVQPGLLLRINTPRNTAEIEAEAMELVGIDVDKFNRERALAILATYTNSVTEAIELTHIMTMQEVHSLMQESADLASGASESSAAEASTSDKDLMGLLDKFGEA